MKSETRNCQNCKQDFVIDPEDFDFYKKMEVPVPTFCWLCRAQRRFAFRNERALYKRKSSYSGKEIFSTYPENCFFPVYTQEEWYSDDWDPLQYARDYDFSRPFFEQYFELSRQVPRPAKSVITLTNSEYSNNASSLKNCYLIFNASYSEDCAYGNGVDYSKDCYDNSHVRKLELSYENFWMTDCSRAFFSVQCADCVDIFFSKNLKGCNNCFGCVNLRGKSYNVFNEQYSKEDYFKKLESFGIGSHKNLERIREEVKKFWLEYPSKYLEGMRNSEVSGAYISNSRNVKKSYLINEGENLKYCQYMQVPSSKECYDHTIWGESTSFTYECAMTGNGTNAVKFCIQCYPNIKNLEYCEYCLSSSDLFGCISLRNKQYCILNKQYTKEDYKVLVAKIKQRMSEMPYKDKVGREYKYGEFFPIEFSPFSYNETLAQEHFPTTKDKALSNGFSWKDIEKKQHTVTLEHSRVPDHIKGVQENIVDEIIGCSHEGLCEHGCTGAFRIIPSEYRFCRKFDIALPRLCPNCRHRIRIGKRNPIKIFAASCQCAGASSRNGIYKNTRTHFHDQSSCPNQFETSFSPDRPDIVYCEQCYNAEVI